MQVPASMLLVATLVVAAGVAPANAADAQLSDAAYMQAARCAGLAHGAKRDTRHVDALLTAQESGRVTWAIDRSEEMRTDAAREARRATGPAGKMQLAGELNDCRAYLGDAQPVGQTALAQ